MRVEQYGDRVVADDYVWREREWYRHAWLLRRGELGAGAKRVDQRRRAVVHREPGFRLHLFPLSRQRKRAGLRRSEFDLSDHINRLFLERFERRLVAHGIVCQQRIRRRDNFLFRRGQYRLGAERKSIDRRCNLRCDTGRRFYDNADVCPGSRSVESHVAFVWKSATRDDVGCQNRDSHQYRRSDADHFVIDSGGLSRRRLFALRHVRSRYGADWRSKLHVDLCLHADCNGVANGHCHRSHVGERNDIESQWIREEARAEVS